MGMLDHLISKNNKEPKDDMEYIYIHDSAWKEGILKTYPVEYGSIVKDVIKHKNRSYSFTLLSDGETYCSNYGWAFAENTKENRKRIDKYHKQKKIYDKEKQKLDAFRNNIIRLTSSNF